MIRGFSVMRKIETCAEVYKGDVNPDDWVVWSLDVSGDGGIFSTIFSGPCARERAVEYANQKYAEFRLRDPDL